MTNSCHFPPQLIFCYIMYVVHLSSRNDIPIAITSIMKYLVHIHINSLCSLKKYIIPAFLKCWTVGQWIHVFLCAICTIHLKNPSTIIAAMCSRRLLSRTHFRLMSDQQDFLRSDYAKVTTSSLIHAQTSTLNMSTKSEITAIKI